jgi:transcriptional regulator with XRE-family HTH domain
MNFQELFEEEKINFGKKIASIANSLSLNQGQLGVRCAINRTEINRIINGKKNLEFETIIKMANGISILTKYLFDYDNQFTLDLVLRKRDLIARTAEEKHLLGQRLLRLRKHKSLIQLDLDLESGIWDSNISRIENALSNAKHFSLFRLAMALGISTYDLFNYEGGMPS